MNCLMMYNKNGSGEGVTRTGKPSRVSGLATELYYSRFRETEAAFFLKAYDSEKLEHGVRYNSRRLPKWRNRQTRTTQNRVPLGGMRVRFPPSAQNGSSDVIFPWGAAMNEECAAPRIVSGEVG
jgi:hypothetical protein